MTPRPRPAARPPRLSREPYEAAIDGFTHGGEGVARIEGKAVFVPGTIPGERVRLRVVDDRKRWARAELLEVLEASPERVEPPCPYVPDCGGCDLQHVAPDAQRRLKTRVVVEQLQRLGGIAHPPVAACVAAGPDTGYRTHAQFHADDDGRLGFHRAASHVVVPVDRCLVLAPAAQAVRDGVGDDTGATQVAVRGHARTGTAAAVLHPGAGPLTIPEGRFAVALAQPDGATVAMRGDATLAERVGGLDYRFDVGGFFQVNTAGAEALVDTVRRLVGDVGGALVWDLYAGVGLLSLPLAAAGGEVEAVEGDATAVARLRDNAAAAGLGVRAHATGVGAFVAAPPTDPPDVVVLDPPRVGAGPTVTATLADLRPASIVYVACDPASLARDARALGDRGYRMVSAEPLDLFPMTHHVEVVSRFVT